MSHTHLRHSVLSALILIICPLLPGCVEPGYGNSGYAGYSGGYAIDYYEPYGGIYGDWDQAYNVGPYRRPNGALGSPRAGHSYQSAPATRSIPTIPSGGGSHTGGHR